MANRTPEKELIDQFVAHAYMHANDAIRIDKLLNADCKCKFLADVEYVSVSGVHWVIEAKSHESSDKYNTIHKLFGEVLKETGRTNRADCEHAVLIPESGLHFYSRGFQCIAKEKFLGFAQLVPIDAVFLASSSGITQISWQELYDAH